MAAKSKVNVSGKLPSKVTDGGKLARQAERRAARMKATAPIRERNRLKYEAARKANPNPTPVGDMHSAITRLMSGDFATVKKGSPQDKELKQQAVEAKAIAVAVSKSHAGVVHVGGYTYTRRGKVIRVRPHTRVNV